MGAFNWSILLSTAPDATTKGFLFPLTTRWSQKTCKGVKSPKKAKTGERRLNGLLHGSRGRMNSGLSVGRVRWMA